MRLPRPSLLACGLLISSAVGCADIPVGIPAPAAALPDGPEPLALRLAVGGLEIDPTADEASKGYGTAEVLESLEDYDVQEELAGWIRAAAVVEDSHEVRGDDLEAQLDQAWEARDDLLVSVRLGRFRSIYEGHNGWYVPNILNWAFWAVPAYFVATEEYKLAFTAEVSVRSVDSNRVLHEGELDIAVEGTFSDMERGWQFFGFLFPNNGAENWKLIVRALLPAAASELGRALVDELRGPFHERMQREDVQEQMRKTMALIVGISHYQDTVNLPPLPYAAADANALAAVLTDPQGSRLASRQVNTLLGSDASVAGLERAVAELAARARPGDQTLFYFAGYGLRSADGEAHLVLNDESGSVEYPLSKLGELLGQVPGQKLVILDCGFDGKGRSVDRGVEPPGRADADAKLLAEALNGAVLLATSPGNALQTPQHLEGSLFTHHLVAGLFGPADLDENGGITPHEMLTYAAEKTVAEAAYDGASQEPILAGQAEVILEAHLQGEEEEAHQ